MDRPRPDEFEDLPRDEPAREIEGRLEVDCWVWGWNSGSGLVGFAARDAGLELG